MQHCFKDSSKIYRRIFGFYFSTSYICITLQRYKKITIMTKFKTEVLDRMLNDPDLFAAIAKAKNVKPSNLGTVIRRNGNSINHYAVVKLVADYLGVDEQEVVEETKIEAKAA